MKRSDFIPFAKKRLTGWRCYRHALLGLVLFSVLSVQAGEWQSLTAIQTTVEAFVHDKLAGETGQRSVTVSRLDQRLKLAKCDQLEPYLPNGARLWGNSSVGIRCTAPSAWSLYVPVSIKVTDNVLVAMRPIPSGQAIQAEDVALQMRDITAFAGSALTSLAQAADRNTITPIAAGTVVRAELLRAAQIIRQGQPVKLIAQGAGFRVSSEGVAMSNAGNGQVVTVKTRSGQLIKGVARSEGVVEVYF